MERTPHRVTCKCVSVTLNISKYGSLFYLCYTEYILLYVNMEKKSLPDQASFFSLTTFSHLNMPITTLNSYSYILDIDEVLEFLHFLKRDLFTANSEDTNFIFHL